MLVVVGCRLRSRSGLFVLLKNCYQSQISLHNFIPLQRSPRLQSHRYQFNGQLPELLIQFLLWHVFNNLAMTFAARSFKLIRAKLCHSKEHRSVIFDYDANLWKNNKIVFKQNQNWEIFNSAVVHGRVGNDFSVNCSSGLIAITVTRRNIQLSVHCFDKSKVFCLATRETRDFSRTENFYQSFNSFRAGKFFSAKFVKNNF